DKRKKKKESYKRCNSQSCNQETQSKDEGR
ncbi:hypothetical protein, partial [uncultured Gammaproteobacteria bacterium]